MKNTIKEQIDDFLKSMNDYLYKIVPNLDLLIDDFYHDWDQDTWKKFNEFLEGLDSISKMFSLMSQYKQYNSNVEEFENMEKKFSNVVKKIGESLENGDRIYTIDLVIYEIKPLLQQINNAIITVLEAN